MPVNQAVPLLFPYTVNRLPFTKSWKFRSPFFCQ
jgi:hypothetical protein